jgi:hypothetical protein
LADFSGDFVSKTFGVKVSFGMTRLRSQPDHSRPKADLNRPSQPRLSDLPFAEKHSAKLTALQLADPGLIAN